MFDHCLWLALGFFKADDPWLFALVPGYLWKPQCHCESQKKLRSLVLTRTIWTCYWWSPPAKCWKSTLWLCQNSYWKLPIYSEFTHWTWWFSIANCKRLPGGMNRSAFRAWGWCAARAEPNEADQKRWDWHPKRGDSIIVGCQIG